MSSSKLIEEEIQKLEAELIPVSSQLDAKLEEFTHALEPAVAAWMTAEVKGQVVRNSEKVNSSGVETLRDLKSDLSALIARLPEVCANAMGKPEEWPHRRPAIALAHRQSSTNESFFAAVFRKSISPLGAVLNKYNLLKEPTGHVSSWEHTSAGNFRYAINPGFDERNFPSATQYNEIRAGCKKKEAELEAKRQELSKAKASELWDEA